ncbi:MAG: hypothetical protein ACFB6R_03340 [Alphaproteobacteria bacterium]
MSFLWSALVNLAAVITLAGVAWLYREGALAPDNALFGAVSILCLFTGFQLLARNGMPMGEALRSMAFEPGSYPAHVFGYLSYLVSTAIGIGIVALSATSL